MISGDRMFNYDFFKSKMQRNSEEKIKKAVYASWYGNTWMILLFLLVFADILKVLMMRCSPRAYVFVYLIVAFLFGIYIGTRKAGLAISKSKLIYVKFKHFGYVEKDVFEIPFEKIKAITVRKILNMRLVKLSFISNLGKFEKVKFLFSSVMVGSYYREYKQASEEIYEELKKQEKIIDKGDF